MSGSKLFTVLSVHVTFTVFSVHELYHFLLVFLLHPYVSRIHQQGSPVSKQNIFPCDFRAFRIDSLATLSRVFPVQTTRAFCMQFLRARNPACPQGRPGILLAMCAGISSKTKAESNWKQNLHTWQTRIRPALEGGWEFGLHNLRSKCPGNSASKFRFSDGCCLVDFLC